jgi:glycosyltransferase involved in cell wall biosynthesis
MARICLVTAHSVSFQPRTLREADCLHDAGHDVRVVSRQVDSVYAGHDARLMQTRKWHWQAVDLRKEGASRRAWLVESLRAKASRRAFDAGWRTIKAASLSFVKGIGQLRKLVASEPADWFIAHTQAALPAAAAAARKWNARLGFDCEDLLAELGSDPPEIVRLIEKEFLPRCDYVSVPSQCIGEHLMRTYHIRNPVVLYNVFPTALAEGMPPPHQRITRRVLRVHWFSQTIGAGRGLEEAVEAVGLLDQDVELHLRGRIADGFQTKLEELARQCNAGGKIIVHPTVGHDELIKTMDEFDVGLALERSDNGNYSRTITNKVFSYLLAGLAIAATDTPGQREILAQIPSTGFLYPTGDAQALADRLLKWQRDRDALRAAQQAAWDAARERFCWDVEQEKLLQVLQLSSVGPAEQNGCLAI